MRTRLSVKENNNDDWKHNILQSPKCRGVAVSVLQARSFSEYDMGGLGTKKQRETKLMRKPQRKLTSHHRTSLPALLTSTAVDMARGGFLTFANDTEGPTFHKLQMQTRAVVDVPAGFDKRRPAPERPALAIVPSTRNMWCPLTRGTFGGGKRGKQRE